MERFWIRSVGSLLTFLLVLCTVALALLWRKQGKAVSGMGNVCDRGGSQVAMRDSRGPSAGLRNGGGRVTTVATV